MDKDRIAQAHNPIGPTLMFKQFTGREEVSRPFEWRLELLAQQNANIAAGDLLGKDITIELITQGNGRRYFNGQVTRFAYIGKENAPGTDLWLYEARLRSWLWYLTRESDCKIFQSKTVPDILDEVFGKYPFPVEKILSGKYRQWEYCVQYQETDFNFVNRLMEHEGIYYYFKHEMGRHTLVLADDLGAHQPVPGYATIPYYPSDRLVSPREEYVASWQIAQEVETGKYFTDDYDYEKPQANLKRPRNHPFDHPHGDHLIYEWPGGYKQIDDGENYAKLRLEELQAPHEMVVGQGNARGIGPGYTFKLKNCPRQDQNREYLIVSASYFVLDNPYRSGGGEGADWKFGLTAQPTTVPYRPPRVTPKPLTSGPQTAVVVGKAGEEIWTDKYGRIKVQFHWDKYGLADENSSCWIRVSHPWAGSNWGGMFMPRIGQEVIVDFIGGDPDYPIITGRVYNAEHMPPYELPKWQEYSTIKSHSTKHGGTTNWNELRFYDYKGKEQVFIHANWRMDVRVKWNKYETVKEQSHDYIGGSYYLTVGKNIEVHAKGDLYGNVEGKINCTSGKEVVLDLQSSYQQLVKTLLEANARNITLEAKMGLVLKSGGSFVKISPLGVTIQGPMVYINPGGSEQGTGDPSIEDPLDASHADTGEPGWLDRPKTGGGWTRGKRQLHSQHGPVLSSQAVRLTRTGGHGTEEDRILVAEQVSKIPPHVLDRLEANGTHIVACQGSVTDYRSELAGVQPRGWPAGSTWDSVPGAYMPGSNEVVIATRGQGTPEGAHVPATGDGHGSSNLAIHETMHGVDHTGGAGGDLSGSPNFQAARTADSGTLGAYESQPGAAGNQETWAESAARHYGGDPNDAANHPNLSNYWNGDPLNPANPKP